MIPITGLEILYIEDDDGDFLLLEQNLKKNKSYRFGVTQAKSIEEALKKMEQVQYDIVLVDLALPDSVGIDTIRHVKDEFPKTPIIVLTGNEDTELAVESLREGVQDVLVKGSIDHTYFPRAILYALERSRMETFKDNLISNISHELRTPMAIVRESISQIFDGLYGEPPDPQKRLLGKAIRNIDRLANIIRNLLDISRIGTQDMELNKEYFDLIEVVREVLSDFTVRASQKGLEVLNTFEDEVIVIYADKEKFIQVLTNLLSNAIKFTHEGHIGLKLSREENGIMCEVYDTGYGIEKDHLQDVFKRFEQFTNLPGPGEKGVGLGLSICKEIVEMHGGEIHVDSASGEGTTFQFTIPDSTPEDFLRDKVTKYLKIVEITERQMAIGALFSEDHQMEMAAGSQDFLQACDEIFVLCQQCLYRQHDVIVKGSGVIYFLLLDTSPEEAELVLENVFQRIKSDVVQSDVLSKFNVRSELVFFPKEADDPEKAISLLHQKVEGVGSKS